MALTDYLKSIADAIREKTGSDDLIPALDFPSIIRSIPQGTGSGDESGLCIDQGVFYADEDISLSRNAASYNKQRLVLPHKLKRKPFFVCFWYDNTLDGGDPSNHLVPKVNGYQSCMGIILESNPDYIWRNYQVGIRINNNNATTMTAIDSNATNPIIEADEDNVYIHGQSSTTVYLFKGLPYRWFIA